MTIDFGGRSLSDGRRRGVILTPASAIFFSRHHTKQAVNYVLFLQCSNTNKLFLISSYEPKHWNSPITEGRKVELNCRLNATRRRPKQKIPEGTSLAGLVHICEPICQIPGQTDQGQGEGGGAQAE